MRCVMRGCPGGALGVDALGSTFWPRWHHLCSTLSRAGGWAARPAFRGLSPSARADEHPSMPGAVVGGGHKTGMWARSFSRDRKRKEGVVKREVRSTTRAAEGCARGKPQGALWVWRPVSP